ncbi:hypothetical protein SDC9_69350 [bioreactor metagenome]|uniref:Uncharacterized protein n=1 Tax=bioreactor metagenome TaxID=1076179 RepID=A0A644Y2X4_9ZZZZ
MKTEPKKPEDLLKPQKYLDELAQSGVKYSQQDVVAVTKNVDGKLIWLEKGNSYAGFEHVMKHADEFVSKGIGKELIPEFLITAVREGKLIGMQRTRPIYQVTFNGKAYKVAIDIGNNGFIVGANMK